MRHGSLFSGIGGFDLASAWMGWENKFHCEWNPFGQKVLHHYWPESEQFTDITKTDFTKYANKIDILTGGFPCQPYSTAGKRLGKEDERHLWPEMLRAIREIQPRWVVGENVRGLTNWNGGMVFDEVQADLETEGYEVTPFLLPACAVNAPHRRDRIWFVAYSNNKGRSTRFRQIQKKNGEIPEWDNNAEFSNTSDGDATNAESKRQSSQQTGTIKFQSSERQTLYGGSSNGYGDKWIAEHANCIGQERGVYENKSEATNGEQFSESNARCMQSIRWENFPTQSPICNGDDGLSNRLDSITFSKWRNESIKAGGNAIVPQVALQIFKAIQEYENQKQNI